MRVWGGRFGEANDERVAAFTRSIDVDRELAADDLAGSIAHVRGLARAGLITEAELATLVEGLNTLVADVAAGSIEWDPDARGRPPEPRGGPDRARRAGGRQAPHRPLAERPGRHGPAPVAAPRDRPARRLDRRVRARVDRSGRTRWRRGHARRDAHPARPARPVRAPSPRLRGDGRTRPWPACRRAAAAQRFARWGPARSRERATRSIARRPQRSSASTVSPRTRSTRSRTATSSSRSSRPWPSGWSTSAGWRRSSPGGRTRASGSCGCRTRSRPAARSCPTRRTRILPSSSVAEPPARSPR